MLERNDSFKQLERHRPPFVVLICTLLLPSPHLKGFKPLFKLLRGSLHPLTSHASSHPPSQQPFPFRLHPSSPPNAACGRHAIPAPAPSPVRLRVCRRRSRVRGWMGCGSLPRSISLTPHKTTMSPKKPADDVPVSSCMVREVVRGGI